jgi:phosphotransferase system enzyme I (PtsI)
MTIRAARRAGKPVAVCGELAGETVATRLLLGMGLQQFSMHAASLLPVKREVLLSDVSELTPRVARLLLTDEPLRVAAGIRRLQRQVPASEAERD